MWVALRTAVGKIQIICNRVLLFPYLIQLTNTSMNWPSTDHFPDRSIYSRIHPSIPSLTHVPTYIYPSTHSCIHPSTHSLIHVSTYSSTSWRIHHPFTPSLTYPPIHPSTHSLTYLSIHSLTHVSIHPSTHSLTPSPYFNCASQRMDAHFVVCYRERRSAVRETRDCEYSPPPTMAHLVQPTTHLAQGSIA